MKPRVYQRDAGPLCGSHLQDGGPTAGIVVPSLRCALALLSVARSSLGSPWRHLGIDSLSSTVLPFEVGRHHSLGAAVSNHDLAVKLQSLPHDVAE